MGPRVTLPPSLPFPFLRPNKPLPATITCPSSFLHPSRSPTIFKFHKPLRQQHHASPFRSRSGSALGGVVTIASTMAQTALRGGNRGPRDPLRRHFKARWSSPLGGSDWAGRRDGSTWIYGSDRADGRGSTCFGGSYWVGGRDRAGKCSFTRLNGLREASSTTFYSVGELLPTAPAAQPPPPYCHQDHFPLATPPATQSRE